jgi:acyl dehydratase
MLPLFARAGLSMVPGASLLPFVAGGGRELPDLALVLDDVPVDRDRVSAYDRVCGYALADSVHATYIHILAFPLQLSLMTDGSFPLPAIGLVHIANQITQHRPVRIGERVSLRVWATRLEPHPRGRQFSLCSQARVGDELVWEERATNLRRGGAGVERSDRSDSRAVSDRAGRSRGAEPSSERELLVSDTWKLPVDLGRRYGSVSGDLNPIHVHRLSARLFGFPTAIAHGMWTMARCLAALDPPLGDKFTVEVTFRKPILLPSTVLFAQAPRARGVRFAVRGAANGTPHLDGTLTPRASAARSGPGVPRPGHGRGR